MASRNNTTEIECFINLTKTENPTVEYQYVEGVVYWNGRNTFVNLLAALIILINSLLIYIILKSSILRKQVNSHKFFHCHWGVHFLRDSTWSWCPWLPPTYSVAWWFPSTPSGLAGQKITLELIQTNSCPFLSDGLWEDPCVSWSQVALSSSSVVPSTTSSSSTLTDCLLSSSPWSTKTEPVAGR